MNKKQSYLLQVHSMLIDFIQLDFHTDTDDFMNAYAKLRVKAIALDDKLCNLTDEAYNAEIKEGRIYEKDS